MQYIEVEEGQQAVMLVNDGDNLQVRSTEDVDMKMMHNMLTTALKALEQMMSGEYQEAVTMVH